MEDIVNFFGSTIERHLPEISQCTDDLIAYHGTRSEKARSIIRCGRFRPRWGRAGSGIYFFEGGQDGLDAAEAFVDNLRSPDDGSGDTVVIKARIRIQNFVDLETPKNLRFVRRMMPLVHEFVMRNRPTSTLDHPHFLGTVLQDCIGHVRGLDSLDAVRTFFAYHKEGASQKGLVVFDPKRIINFEVVLGIESC